MKIEYIPNPEIALIFGHKELKSLASCIESCLVIYDAKINGRESKISDIVTKFLEEINNAL